MARIKYGSIISDISGSVGSATFQKSLYGNTLRNRPRNSRAGTADQFTARNKMMQCQYAWRLMSEASRRQWNQFVAFSGQSINRDRGILTTGHALFLKWNYARLAAGLSIVSTLVYKSAPAWPDLQSIALDAPGIMLTFTANLVTLDICPIIFLSPSRPASQNYIAAGTRFMFIDHIVAATAEIESAYQNKFGASIVAGDFVHCKWQYFNLSSPIISAISSAVYEVQ